MVVVVLALFTVWAVAGVDDDPLKLPSPLYVAVSDLAPTDVNVIVHWPAAGVPVQLWVPSLTVTVPVGAVGVLPVAGVTPYCTVTP
jgi:hypothetical protein